MDKKIYNHKKINIIMIIRKKYNSNTKEKQKYKHTIKIIIIKKYIFTRDNYQ